MAISSPSAFDAGDFNTGLGDCCAGGASACLDAWLCTYCQVSAQYNMLTMRQRGTNGFVAAALCCLDSCVTCGLALHCFSAHLRTEAKREMGLTKETTCESFMKSCFCTCCSVGQVYREMSIRHLWPGGICVDAAYVKPGVVAPLPQQMIGGQHVEMQQYPNTYNQPPSAHNNGYPSPHQGNVSGGGGYPQQQQGVYPIAAVAPPPSSSYPSYNNQLAQGYPPIGPSAAPPAAAGGSYGHAGGYGQPQPPAPQYQYGPPPPAQAYGQPPREGPSQPVLGYQGQHPVAGPKTIY